MVLSVLPEVPLVEFCAATKPAMRAARRSLKDSMAVVEEMIEGLNTEVDNAAVFLKLGVAQNTSEEREGKYL